MSLDTARPFRLDVDQDWVRLELDAIFHMDAPGNMLALYVHGISLDGSRTVSANVGDRTVLYRTVVTPAQYAELEQRTAEYNADTEAGWAALVARLAAEHLGYLEFPGASVRNPYDLLRFDSFWNFDEQPTAAPAVQEKTGLGYRVEMPLPNGFIRLYLGDRDPVAEVAWFNMNPGQGLAYLWASALAERTAQRQKGLESLAAAQVRDIRAIQAALHRAVHA